LLFFIFDQRIISWGVDDFLNILRLCVLAEMS